METVHWLFKHPQGQSVVGRIKETDAEKCHDICSGKMKLSVDSGNSNKEGFNHSCSLSLQIFAFK